MGLFQPRAECLRRGLYKPHLGDVNIACQAMVDVAAWTDTHDLAQTAHRKVVSVVVYESKFRLLLSAKNTVAFLPGPSPPEACGSQRNALDNK